MSDHYYYQYQYPQPLPDVYRRSMESIVQTYLKELSEVLDKRFSEVKKGFEEMTKVIDNINARLTRVEEQMRHINLAEFVRSGIEAGIRAVVHAGLETVLKPERLMTELRNILLTDVRTSIADLVKEVAEIMRKAAEPLITAAKEISDAARELRDLRSTMSALSMSVSRLSSQISEIAQMIDSLRAEMTAIKSKLNDVDRAIKSLSERAETKRGSDERIQALSSEISQEPS